VREIAPGQRTARGYCLTCGAAIAWAKVGARQQLFNPVRSADGSVTREQVRNGKGRMVWRPKPDMTSPHPCDAPRRPEDAVAPQVEARVARPDPPEPVVAPMPQPPQFDRAELEAAHALVMAPPDQDEAPAAIPVPVPAPAPLVPVVDLDAIKPLVRAEMVAILDEYGVEPPPPPAIKVVGAGIPDGAQIAGISHPMLPRLLALLARREDCYLHGPAGTGKTFAAKQAGEALALRVAIEPMPGIQSPSRIFGFKTASGEFSGTVFADYYTHGGAFVADEFDRMLPEVASAFNAPLANGWAVINGDVIKRHPDFVFIANGNTDLRGATVDYSAAQSIDYATAARFAFVPWLADAATTKALTVATARERGLAGKAAADLAMSVIKTLANVERVVAQYQLEKVLCGPREAIRITRDIACGASMISALDAYVFKGMSKVDRERFAGVEQ
jgi:hypothetical protein